jgi:hypothetical protein
MFGSTFKFGSPEQMFWLWFAENSEQLLVVKTAEEPICDELDKKIREIHPGLAFAFGPIKDGQRDFIISADGSRELFPVVKKLAAAAPDLPGWTIIAFRPPGNIEASVKFGDYQLGPDDIWFITRPAPRGMGLTLFIKGLSGQTREVLTQAIMILLDNALGEYNVEAKIKHLDLRPLPGNPAELGLRPFRELPKVIGN